MLRLGKAWGVPVALAGFSLSFAALAGAAPATVSKFASKSDASITRTLASKSPSGWASVILKMNGGLTPAKQARLQALGADITRHLDLINSITITVPKSALAQVAALPFVSHLSDNMAVRKCDEFTDASSGAEYAFQKYALTGQGVGVAVLDSGVRYSQDFQPAGKTSRVIGAISFVSKDTSTDDACGHGTHVAGIIGGSGLLSSGSNCFHTYIGVARLANIVNVRVLDQNGESDVSTVISGLQWVVSHKRQ
ncbi:MAG: S8 family serine peptidase [Janthinobacterium lividum]